MHIILFIWNDMWNCLMGISAPISAIGMMAVTYYIYKLTNKDHKKEDYFCHMVDSYFKIEEEIKTLTELNVKKEEASSIIQAQKEQCYRVIAANSNIMQHYLSRIPGYYINRLKFFEILYSLSHYPEEISIYDDLSNIFQDFCQELIDKKRYIYTFPSKYDGQPIAD